MNNPKSTLKHGIENPRTYTHHDNTCYLWKT